MIRCRVIPVNDKATKVLKFWADQFPDRKPEHFAFPSEGYGAGGDDFEPTVFDVDPETPIGSWKEAWGWKQFLCLRLATRCSRRRSTSTCTCRVSSSAPLATGYSPRRRNGATLHRQGGRALRR
jgi:hypothetical protein